MLVLIMLTICISDCLFLAHIVKIRMNELSVLFIFLFFKEAVQIWPYANSLDHLDCNLGALAVYYNKKIISGSKFLSPSLNLRLCYLSTIWISDCLHLAHIVEIRMNSLSVYFNPEVHLFIFRGSCSNFELMRILLIICISVIVHWQYFIMNFLFQEANFSSNHWRQSLTIGTCACANYLHHFDFRLFIFGSHSLSKSG